MTNIAFQILAGWFVIDLLTGLWHLLIDTRRDGGPLLRSQVRDFQVHHHKPTSILTHSIIARCWLTTTASLPALLFACFGAPWFWITVFVGGMLCQQAHYWSHHPRPPAIVRALQMVGVLLSPDGHARHHRDFQGAYCILCGWANGTIDQILTLRNL